jgi:hypothetical protein
MYAGFPAALDAAGILDEVAARPAGMEG